ncbi:response regulator transcription factor [Marinilongibacter aquaticus]|uniref:response regulator n=1 Tax=Marinilongibacter aquaticus TaxID=2975157 RepID=UPI0021BD80F2|nr:response regulator transcription factor [Marinilongibacter aquaticus]UBM58359.1 response regulator transcription factor [Marinilongibacter aquaticus]
MIKVTLYEDVKDIREMLSEAIQSCPDLYLLEAHARADDVLINTRRNKPHVILMDIQMPGLNGIEAVRLLKQKYPEVQVCMQTVFEENERIFAAICAGANGYILKGASPEKYISAIFDTHEGGSAMSPTIARKVLTMFQNQNAPVKEFVQLTPTERKVLEKLVQGMSYKMMAADLAVSFATVNFHIKNIYKKLHVNSANEAIRLAIQNGLV